MRFESHLSEQDRKTAGEALQQTFIDLLDLSLTAKRAHWNPYGPLFRSFHEQLDDLVATARSYADDAAERAASLTVSPDGRAATIASHTQLHALPAGWIQDAEAVEAITEALNAVIGRVRGRIADTASADPVTQDQLVGLGCREPWRRATVSVPCWSTRSTGGIRSRPAGPCSAYFPAHPQVRKSISSGPVRKSAGLGGSRRPRSPPASCPSRTPRRTAPARPAAADAAPICRGLSAGPGAAAHGPARGQGEDGGAPADSVFCRCRGAGQMRQVRMRSAAW